MMDVELKQRVYDLEKEAIEIQEEINAVNYRLANYDSIEVLKNSKRQLKLLDKDLKRNTREMAKILKLMKKANK